MKSKIVKNPLDKLPEILTRNIEKNLCVCNEVPKETVINAIANGATTVEEVKK
jgi:NAD(P)H-nitrite reductase large subunit